MKFLEQSAGRGMEICVGIIVLVIAIIFLGLVVLIVFDKMFGFSSALSSIALAFLSYWFGQLGYRLVMNKPRIGGGLLSPTMLKVGCGLFGISSILLGIISVSRGGIGSALSALVMLVACLYGWQVAKNRNNNHSS